MEKGSQEESAKQQEEQQQEEIKETSSGVRYKGVRMRKWGKWVAEVRLPNSRERIWLGSYETPEKAARAYDAAVFCLRGPTATFNFPNSRPEIPSGGMLTSDQIRDVARKYAYEEMAETTPSQDPTPVSEPPVADWRKVAEETPWNPDLSAFGSAEFDEFPVGRFFPEEDDGQNEDDDLFYHPSPLWSF